MSKPNIGLLSDEEKNLIRKLRLAGKTFKQIGKTIHRSDKTVSAFLKVENETKQAEAPAKSSPAKKPAKSTPAKKPAKPTKAKCGCLTYPCFDEWLNQLEAIARGKASIVYEMFAMLVKEPDTAIEPCICEDATIQRLLDDAVSCGMIEKHVLYSLPDFGTMKKPAKKAKK